VFLIRSVFMIRTRFADQWTDSLTNGLIR